MKDKVITLRSVFILHGCLYTRISKCQANSETSGRHEKVVLLHADIHTDCYNVQLYEHEQLYSLYLYLEAEL